VIRVKKRRLDLGRQWLLPIVAALPALNGCYYMQAISGHSKVMSERRPMADIINDPDAPQTLKERLELVQQARQFSIDVLKLPDNDSYRSYADLGRDYVVWNVFAAPEFSLQPKEWCYPVAGCVAYRGYFAREDALREARKLEADGFDVSVLGVSAYSTLGRFADPVLNTMLRWSDADLVATLFHELAHQKLYVKGATQFNESFASAVAEIGMERWLPQRDGGQGSSLEAYRRSLALRRDLLEIVEGARAELAGIYAANTEADEKRRRKAQVMNRLSAEADRLFVEAGIGASPLGAPLNNARLVSLGLYESWVPAFKAVYEECARDIECFYRSSRELADLDPDQRSARLAMLADAGIG
jgi:predicted aminopeptidase